MKKRSVTRQITINPITQDGFDMRTIIPKSTVIKMLNGREDLFEELLQEGLKEKIKQGSDEPHYSYMDIIFYTSGFQYDLNGLSDDIIQKVWQENNIYPLWEKLSIDRNLCCTLCNKVFAIRNIHLTRMYDNNGKLIDIIHCPSHPDICDGNIMDFVPYMTKDELIEDLDGIEGFEGFESLNQAPSKQKKYMD